MNKTVLDSYAVLACLFKETSHQKVLELFEKAVDTDSVALIAASNWAEVRYMIERKAGAVKWLEARDRLLGLPLEIVAALARQNKAELYTGDPEFKSVEKEIRIVWL